ncbi:Fatty acid desaturase [Ectocarpus siliculosus]|uniref:Fatty acid desaturase n=1 Tax=Ectocarpus siliculosus TaxID=2880 RepID=D7FQQ2_ECTSI|nr:Fatty acid desaturase [Ectocarpus siliculosus]|eukprot:CBJ49159.1 Fatty acid desaturase [Ectocarpus siliculosus]
MGRGGRSAHAFAAGRDDRIVRAQHILEGSVLADNKTEELKQFAEERGLKTSGKREDLLIALHPFSKGIAHRYPAPKPLPLARPPFKFSDVQKAVPRHCFKRNLATSATHLASDLIMVATFGYLATFISGGAIPAWAGWLLWPTYWFVQGTQMTGVWVLAHECGHQSFSESKTINNLVGLVCHSALLVPYHSWRITHAKHHNNTGSCTNDEVFCPPVRTDNGKSPTAEEDMAELVHEAPLVQMFWIIFMLVLGWMPGYLCFNATGPSKYNGLAKSHFNPWAKMFEERDRMDIVTSDLGFFVAVAGICYAVHALGFLTVAKFYLVPYMVTNAYLVLITYLQHTDVFMPHFRGSEWDWFRGALCTVDRTFGPVIDHVIHHIADTHVCHHLFSKMPFYHAQEATEHIRAFLGDYHLSDTTPIPKALWRSFTCCTHVEDVGHTVFYQAH